MNPALAPSTLALAVVAGGFVIGFLLGAVGQATRFCVRGAIADWVALRMPGRLVSWLVAVAVGAVVVQVLVSMGSVDATRTIYWSERFPWLSYLVGGLLFGYGMILAGGCPQRCLVKAGEGNLKALATLVVVAIVSLMTLRGAFAPIRVNVLDAVGTTLAGPQDIGAVLARLTGASTAGMRWLVALLVVVAIGALAWRVRSQVRTGHWVGGVVVGLLLGAALFLTGTIGFLPEHPETLEAAWLGTQSKRPEGLTFSAPLGHSLDLLTLWSDKATVATFGVMVALGVLVGAFCAARLRGQFRVESFRTPVEMRDHTAGAALMGFGGITAMGCSIGNGVTGLGMLSLGAVLAVAGISVGAWIAVLRQMKQGAVTDPDAAPAAG